VSSPRVPLSTTRSSPKWAQSSCRRAAARHRVRHGPMLGFGQCGGRIAHADTDRSYPVRSVMTKQLLHLVLGGELTHLDGREFKDVSKLDIVGIFPNYAEAHRAWKA